MELTDVLHHYLGARMITDQGPGQLVCVQTDDMDCSYKVCLDSGRDDEEVTGGKLVLRHLSTMTREDRKELNAFVGKTQIPVGVPADALAMAWYFQNGFDVFDLIGQELAVDADDQIPPMPAA